MLADKNTFRLFPPILTFFPPANENDEFNGVPSIGIEFHLLGNAYVFPLVIELFDSFNFPNQFEPDTFLKLSVLIASVLIPVDAPISKKPSSVSSLDTISISAPATSPMSCGLNVLFTETLWITSVPKKSSEIFLFKGSSEGSARPFNVVLLYLSPRPRTKTLAPLADCVTPVIFVNAPLASLTPFRDSSCEPIFSSI